jgi:hypothetical protein
MYQVRKLYTGLIAGLCLSLLFSCVWASVISVPELTFQSPGEVVTGDILLDSAPDGISGFLITLSVADAEMCEITGITFPEWAGLKGTSPLPESVVAIQAVDIGDVIETNSTGILLAQVSVTAKVAGSTSLLITVTQLDDDSGNPVMETVPVIHEETTTSVPSGTTTSATATMMQSGGGSGGSGSGASYTVTGGSSGSTPASPVKTVSVTLSVPSQGSGSSEIIAEGRGAVPSQQPISSEDTAAESVIPSPTKAPLMVWGIVCGLFCAGVIIRSKRYG